MVARAGNKAAIEELLESSPDPIQQGQSGKI
ncbi:hypothetical protein PENCOP_c009G03550 [Penicillium coprophilum]|uniref:Uncharacterized protein n=1 Tax=Penicillium coprophilum TaxID=36646 RepID=A0A1V6UHR2_9EURO|nr:hypothetical protein PENCOP_c009G03550 [Penicillium coprophilum]